MAINGRRPLQILYLEDNPYDADICRATLRSQGLEFQLKCVTNELEYREALERGQIDLILSDNNVPKYSGLKALELAKTVAPACPFIILSGSIGEEVAVEYLRRGVADYVLKDRPARLATVITRALEEAKQRQDREKDQERIRQQAALLDLAQDAIIVGDLESKVQYWNKGAERIHGWRAEEVIGMRTVDFLYTDCTWMDQAVTSLQLKGEWDSEITKKTKSGGEILVHTRCTLVRNREGDAKSVLSISSDITEKKRMEQELFRAQRLESIGLLAGGIAHDLKNVLTPIMMGAKILQEELPAAEKTEVLNVIKSCAQRGADMVSRILSFARGAGGKPVPVRIEEIMGEVLNLVRDSFPKSVQASLELEPGLPLVLANATQIHQVLLNFCVNSRDAMPQGGVIRMSGKRIILNGEKVFGDTRPAYGDFVRISVEDNGEGMGPETLAKIGQPFFTTKSEGKGTGLGLSTALGIVKNHGGFMDITSERGKGSTFSIYLPCFSSE